MIKRVHLFYRGKELIIFGEMDKWIPMSRQRVKKIQAYGQKGMITNVKLEVEGAAGEIVDFYMSWGGEIIKITCTFYEGGSRFLDFKDRNCIYN